jgi:hypothetical protein
MFAKHRGLPISVVAMVRVRKVQVITVNIRRERMMLFECRISLILLLDYVLCSLRMHCMAWSDSFDFSAYAKRQLVPKQMQEGLTTGSTQAYQLVQRTPC